MNHSCTLPRLVALALGLATLLLVAGWVFQPARAGAAPAVVPQTDFTVRIPSPAATGSPTGTLVVRVVGPAAGQARYPEGAPVLVFASGGDGTGSLSVPVPLATDTICISFLHPGGCQGPVCSDGTYDHRGPRCIAALRDVTLYAAGLLDDVMGYPIDHVVDVPVLHDNIGLLGSSNGGNIVVAVAALHGDALNGYLRYLVQWESPVSSQIATVDLGGPRQDCTLGSERVMSVNPWYQGYGPLAVVVDHSALAYNPANPVHPVFWDGNGNGTYDTVLDPNTGCQSPDLNLDGVLDTNEDFPLTAYEDVGGRAVYSRPATHAMAVQGIIPGPWPSTIATPIQADAYWDLREAVRLYTTATLKIPDLRGMTLSSTNDHVQIAVDRPHIHQAFDGWRAANGWVRINPGRAYVVEVNPALSTRTDLPDNAPNTAPTNWAVGGVTLRLIDISRRREPGSVSGETSYTYPDDLDRVYEAAAVHEMADRVRAGRWYEVYLPLVAKD